MYFWILHYLIQVYFFTNYFWCYRNHTLECIDEIFFFSFFSLIWFPFFFSLHLISIFRVFRSQFILTEHITVRNYLFLRTLHIGYFDQDVKIIRLIYMYNTLKYTAHIQITDILSYTHTCIRMHTLNMKRPKTVPV